MTLRPFDLLVIGEINPDLILQGGDLVPAFGQSEKLVENARLTIGSSSVMVACGAARLGLSTAFIGVVGDDLFGHFMLDAMQAHGIDISACKVKPSLSTGFSVILSQPQDRAILTYAGSISRLSRSDINLDLLGHARHLHLSSYFLLDGLRPHVARLFQEAKTKGVSTSLDTNWDPSGHWDGGLSEVLPLCDIFLPNEAEAREITGTKSLTEALDVLSKQIPIIAVKAGSKGGVARYGDERITSPPLAVDVVDTTGAGDSFDAGFLYAYIHDWSPQEALRLACACGSLSTLGVGGTECQPTLVEAQEALLRGTASETEKAD